MKNLVGKIITYGRTRYIYEHKFNNKYIIKYNPRILTNKTEWYVWKNCLQYRKILVSCIDISDCGQFLVMLKGNKLEIDDKIPKTPKGWMDVRKPSNFVKIKNKILLCDYGHSSIRKILVPDNIIKEWEENCRAYINFINFEESIYNEMKEKKWKKDYQ